MDPLGRPDICSKDPEHVTHLQMMLVTPGCDPAYTARIWTGVGWAFDKFTEAAVNDFQEKNRDLRNLLLIQEFSNTLEEIE